MQLQQRKSKIFENSLNINDVNLINVHKIYNSSSINHNEII